MYTKFFISIFLYLTVAFKIMYSIQLINVKKLSTILFTQNNVLTEIVYFFLFMVNIKFLVFFFNFIFIIVYDFIETISVNRLNNKKKKNHSFA